MRHKFSLQGLLVRLIAGTWAAAAVLALPSAAFGQDADEAMTKAKEYYSAAKYDQVITLLTSAVTDSKLAKDKQKDMFLLLGRSYLAKGRNDEARWAISNMLELEPPIIEPDPDTECPPLMKIYYDVRKSMKGSYEIERSDPGIQTMAILDFKNRSVTDKEKFDPMEKGFAELLIGQLQGNVNLKLVERERISWILDEVGMENNPELFDVNSAVRLGKQLGVHVILLGSFIVVNDQIKLLSRLVKVETGEILATDEAAGEVDEFFGVTTDLGTKVAKKINVTIDKGNAKVKEDTRSLDAILKYSEGLALVEKGQYKDAYEKFKQAVELDPNYEKARDRIESLKPLIG